MLGPPGAVPSPAFASFSGRMSQHEYVGGLVTVRRCRLRAPALFRSVAGALLFLSGGGVVGVSLVLGGRGVVGARRALRGDARACTGCHDGPASLAHAEINTTASGVESCAACHGPGRLFAVSTAHPPVR
jgi:hypothetical protein